MSETVHKRKHSSKNYQNQNQMIDEINLLDISKIFFRQKWLILCTTFLCTAITIIIVLRLLPEYRSEVTLLPPLAETIEKLNIPNYEEKGEEYFFKVDPQDLYTELILNLQSNHLRKQFFDNNNLLQHLSKTGDNRTENMIFQDDFSQKLSIAGITPKKEDTEFIVITLEGSDPARIAEWLNSFIQLADQETISGQTRSFETKIRIMKNSISKKIESLRTTEKSRRLDTIAQFKEATIIARKLGWINQPENPVMQYEKANTRELDMSFSLQKMPLYLRGAKALQAEIDVLSDRKNDDPFIPDLRSLQEKLNFLSSVTQDTSNIHSMRLDQAAIVSEHPVKPKRKLLIIVGFISGFIFSLIIALLRNAISNNSK
jgi:chain length determinant protein (polysaccharide antigen chain regulator)